MAKTYIDTIKYLVKGDIEVDGIVDKADVIGAIFGQTEGLLGDGLDLRDLQKSGRIGRIEVDLKTVTGKSVGQVEMPSSLDKAETAILAAALETVDRVGPCEAKIKITALEDTRSDKRGFVIDRAKELLRTLGDNKDSLESKEISSLVKANVKKANLEFYGKGKVPCGPGIEDAEEIIIVEGRADVLNLLSYGINNVISLRGAKTPPEVVTLSKKKKVILFVDGDRGGDIIVRNFAEVGNITFLTKAPDGKEVEELTEKEIIKCLRTKREFTGFSDSRTRSSNRRERSPRDSRTQRGSPSRGKPRDSRPSRFSGRSEVSKPKLDENLENIYNSVKGTMKACFLDSGGELVGEVPVAEMINTIKDEKDIDTVVFDGIITQRLVDIASSKKIKTLVGLKVARIDDKRRIKILAMS